MASSSSIFLGMSVAVAMNEYKQLTDHGKPTLKPVYGGFVGGLFLLLINAANEEVATVLLTLIVATAVVKNGASLITATSKAVS